MSVSYKFTSKGTWRQVSESGPIHSVLLLYMLSTQPDPLPPCYTLYRMYRPVLIHTEKGEG
jgi:hypothetical protein